jgi:hypothetical protein
MISTQLFWIDGPWPGRLALAARPRGGDWLEDEMKAWAQSGVGTVVSLLTRDEELSLGLEKESVEYQECCLKVRPDGTILDGHHRVHVLRGRGEDVDALPREVRAKDKTKRRADRRTSPKVIRPSVSALLLLSS